MTTFWILAAILLTIALVLIVPHLLRSGSTKVTVNRTQQNILIAKEKLNDLENEYQRGAFSEDDYAQARKELEQDLLVDADDSADAVVEQKKPAYFTAFLIALVIPAVSIFVYLELGNPQSLDPKTLAGKSTNSIEEMMSSLKKRLDENPDDSEGWLMLGRSYMAESHYADAEKIFSQELKKTPDNADLMLLKADALAMQADGVIGEESAALIGAALEVDPNNFTGLWLAGMVAREEGEKETARQHWEKLQTLLPAGSEDLANLEELLAQLDAPPIPSAEDIDKMIDQLEQKMQDEPENATGWTMLGRSYMMLKRFPEAVHALDKALALTPEDPELMLSLADAIAMTNEGQMAGRPQKLIDQALAVSPNNPKALWLAGITAREAEDHEKAIGYWQTLLPLIADDAGSTQEVQALIQEAGGTVTTASKPTPKAASTISVVVKVDLDESLRDKASPEDTVFIYVKASEGPQMPLAAVRKQVKDLPLEITLDESMGMMPQMKMSNFDAYKVGARVSRSGQAISASGDFIIEKSPVKAGETIELTISDTVR